MSLFLLLTTESSIANAERLATKLLERRLAACISFKEIRSHYIWQNKLEKVEEVELLIKTEERLSPLLIQVVKELHSYEIPELIFWSPSSSDSYGEWIKKVCLD